VHTGAPRICRAIRAPSRQVWFLGPRRSDEREADRARCNMDRISLLMCNIGDRTDRRNLREAFERYGHVKDVYIPTDFHTK